VFPWPGIVRELERPEARADGLEGGIAPDFLFGAEALLFLLLGLWASEPLFPKRRLQALEL
jgi:hypothetical protein